MPGASERRRRASGGGGAMPGVKVKRPSAMPADNARISASCLAITEFMRKHQPGKLHVFLMNSELHIRFISGAYPSGVGN
jgi:hypothetical protein